MSAYFANIAASPLAGCLLDVQVNHEARTGIARLCCPPDFSGFAGHFPEAPVLPAVMQLLAVRLVSEVIAGADLLPVSVERLKFKGMVSPGEVVRLRVALTARNADLGAGFALDREGTAIAGGTIVFRRPDREV